MRFVVRIGLTIAVLAEIFSATSSVATADPVATTAVVLKVVDGDTIDVRDDVRGRLRVRILGIDTPETKKPGNTVGCWGPEATEFAKGTLVGRRVAVVPDPTQDRTDRYGRTLAYLVGADGWDYSVEAARAGAGHSYIYNGKPVLRYVAIVAAEAEARDAGRGLWGPPRWGDTASAAQSALSRGGDVNLLLDPGVTFAGFNIGRQLGAGGTGETPSRSCPFEVSSDKDGRVQFEQ